MRAHTSKTTMSSALFWMHLRMATPEAQARTRAFARVLGPYLVIVPGLIMAGSS
jgi:hypothetical protein